MGSDPFDVALALFGVGLGLVRKQLLWRCPSNVRSRSLHLPICALSTADGRR